MTKDASKVIFFIACIILAFSHSSYITPSNLYVPISFADNDEMRPLCLGISNFSLKNVISTKGFDGMRSMACETFF